MNQQNALVNTDIHVFDNWFHNHFVPTVRNQLGELGEEQRAVPMEQPDRGMQFRKEYCLLNLDNCSEQPGEDCLILKDGNIIAKFVPLMLLL